MSDDRRFAAIIKSMAERQLRASLSTEEGKKAAQSVMMSFLSALKSARNPEAFMDVSESSLATCVSLTLETGLHPGGPNPTVYLVPQSGHLQWRITHRGLSILAARLGYDLTPVPVSTSDHVRVAYLDAYEHEADPDAWPTRIEDLQGVIIVVRRMSDGVILKRPWMPRVAIEQRRRVARSKNVWDAWPVEMAQKTAIKWAFARGLIPAESPELRQALEADAAGDVYEAERETELRTRPDRLREELGLPEAQAEARALPDHGEVKDFAEEVEKQAAAKEKVEVSPLGKELTPKQAPPPADLDADDMGWG